MTKQISGLDIIACITATAVGVFIAAFVTDKGLSVAVEDTFKYVWTTTVYSITLYFIWGK